MRVKFLSIVAALALVAGCESDPETEIGGESSGTVVSSPSGSAAVGSAGVGGAALNAPVPPGTQQDFTVNVGDTVYFDYDRYSVRDDARPVLERQAAWLRRYPSVRVVIEGHCDERGTREYNLALGERRANSVKDYLIALGVNSSQVRTISYGKEKPVCVSSDSGCYAKNRRGATKITGGAGS